ncbi:AMP-binding protein [Novosphingobium sp.]|uniref:AMP-binding protein n=1 Tax=Novosphingobium sp. TaxID=1874826 RepID=UPI0027355FA2|nr:AMP-binding protein [Novosphingobium sp.]MDP3908462.1 AMP-binding protein [Novosphingobium sp.]
MTDTHTDTIRAGGLPITRAELLARVERTAAGLIAVGVTPGERVALILPNCLAFVEITLAAGRIGAFVVPINWHFKPGEIEYLLDDSTPRALFVADTLATSLPGSWQGRVPVFAVAEPEQAQAQPDHALPDYATWRDSFAPCALPRQVAPGSIVYTSGTTGRPKGVQRVPATPDQQDRMQALRAAMYQLTPDSRVAIPGPLYHAFPNQLALYAAMTAQHVEIMPRFDPEAFLALIERERITSVGLAPIMFVRLLRLPAATRRAYDLSSLRWAIHAGGPCAADVKRAMIDWWGPVIAEYYGGTESGPLTLCDSAQWLAHPGTCGKPVDGAELRIIGPDGLDVPRGAPGEIFGRLRHYPDFIYRGDPAKRAEVALGDLVTLGDVGYQDADGFLYLYDRVRDMVVSGGVNIYPAEVEGALFGLEGVDDCAVIGVPDSEYGERLVALVSGTALDPRTLREQLKERIAGYKVPREIVIVAALERDASGKLRKAALRERFLAERAEYVPAA